jgi:MoaA/NifB/PqqE/SkfB family radical SAM enzyme
VTRSDLLPAWSRILRGYRPLLSIEITKECPLRCPGCYAYVREHLGGLITLRDLNDRKGEDLVSGVLAVCGKRPGSRRRPLIMALQYL